MKDLKITIFGYLFTFIVTSYASAPHAQKPPEQEADINKRDISANEKQEAEEDTTTGVLRVTLENVTRFRHSNFLSLKDRLSAVSKSGDKQALKRAAISIKNDLIHYDAVLDMAQIYLKHQINDFKKFKKEIDDLIKKDTTTDK